MADLTWTNTWLGILAVISLIQFLILCVAGVFAYRMYQTTMATIETVERAHIAPLRARVDSVLDQVQQMTDKVRHAQESVSDALHHVTGTGSAVADAVKSKAWPIVGILQGLKSIASDDDGQRSPRTHGQAIRRDVGFRCTGVRTARGKSAISSRYERCTRIRSTGSHSGFLRTAPLLCGATIRSGGASAGASSRHFNADVGSSSALKR